MARVTVEDCIEKVDNRFDLDDLRESLVVGLQRVITDDDMPDEVEEAPLLGIEHGEAQPQAEKGAKLFTPI